MIHGAAAIKIYADKLESLLSNFMCSVIRCKKSRYHGFVTAAR